MKTASRLSSLMIPSADCATGNPDRSRDVGSNTATTVPRREAATASARNRPILPNPTMPTLIIGLGLQYRFRKIEVLCRLDYVRGVSTQLVKANVARVGSTPACSSGGEVCDATPARNAPRNALHGTQVLGVRFPIEVEIDRLAVESAFNLNRFITQQCVVAARPESPDKVADFLDRQQRCDAVNLQQTLALVLSKKLFDVLLARRYVVG